MSNPLGSTGAGADIKLLLNKAGTATGTESWEDGVKNKTTAPASASDTGTPGEIRIVSGFAYFCVGVNQWERVAIASWV